MDTLKELKEIYVKLAGVIGDIQEPPPDPLAEWRALEPGRKVFYPREQQVYTFMGIDDEQMIFENDEGEWDVDITEKELSKWQIIPLGPFDGRKCYPGMWVWVESKQKSVVHGWQQIIKQPDGSSYKGVWVCGMDQYTHWVFEFDGSSMHLGGSTMHYYPPSLDAPQETEDQRKERAMRELAKDKRFVEFALKVVSDGDDFACPVNHRIGRCDGPLGGTQSVCHQFYGSLYACPCIQFGPSVVKADLLHIIKLAAGV